MGYGYGYGRKKQRTVQISGRASLGFAMNNVYMIRRLNTPPSNPNAPEEPAPEALTTPAYLQFGEKLAYGNVLADAPSSLHQSKTLSRDGGRQAGETDWYWKTAWGDWWDSAGVVQGTSAFATAVISTSSIGQAVTWSGSGMVALIQKIMDEGTAGIILVKIPLDPNQTGPRFASRDNTDPGLRPVFNITTTVDTYTVGALRDNYLAAISNPNRGLDPEMRQPALIMPDLSTVQGTVTSASMTLYTTLGFTGTFSLFALKTDPLITKPETQLGGVEYGLAAQCENDLQLPTKFPSQVLFYPSFASQAACEAAGWTNVDFSQGKPDLDSFQHVKEYGLNLMRIKSRYPGHPFSDGSTLISWKWLFPNTTTKEAYVRFLIRLSPEILQYMNETGIKTPGFEGPLNGAQTTRFSYRGEHSSPSEANPHVYSMFRHAYDAENSQLDGFAENRAWGNTCLLAGTGFANIACIEQRVKINTLSGGVWQADGIDQAWVNGVKVYNDTARKIVDLVNDFGGGDWINSFFFNYYHGGVSTPTGLFTADFGAVCVSTQYIGPPPKQSLERDINGNSWATTWNHSFQRVDMQYSNAHQHTDGRQLEFSMALHSRAPGDNTGVRWADFSSTAAPTGGYLWANDDALISEHDNFATAYLPWKGWVILFGRNSSSQVGALISGEKIISIDGTPSAIFRNVDAANQDPDGHITDHIDVVYPTGAGLTAIAADDKWHNTNYNPACWVNPTGTKTGWWGGGYSSSFPGSGNGSLFKLLDDNPNYPATSTKQLRLRVFRPTGAPSPLLTRHMVQIGDWLYWGGGFINNDASGVTKDNNGNFYRIYVPDLMNVVFTQEAITPAANVALYPNLPNIDNNVRYNLLCADTVRKKLIYMNINGVYRYSVPDDDGSDGTWEGPITFGMTSNEWASTISEGKVDLPPPEEGGTGNWHGLIGTHRSDLNQTFFRYNASRRWNRIRWTD
jgi:hypothetical protein